MEDYPDELRASLLPVVALWGCTPLHSKIKDGLDQNRALRIHSYTSMEDVCVVRHSKRLSYENYTPKGILKANWMYRVVNKHAAVIVMFYEWCGVDGADSEGTAWATRETQIAQEIADMQKAVFHDGKQTNRILICFVSDSATGPDVSNEERISNLRRRVDMQDKAFFSCSRADFENTTTSPSVGRLEAVIREMASAYYLEEARLLKKRKDLINRKQHPQLYVRNHFKIAFLNEFRGDVRVAIKYYSAAYSNLREIPKERKLIVEVKDVADYLNFKLCTLYVQQKPNQPDYALRDIIAQFQRHAKTYKGLLGAPEHEAEHWCWLSRQYSIMGEFVGQFSNVAVLKAVPFGERQYRNTGYYYHAAAVYAMERKKAALASAEKYLTEEDLAKYANVLPTDHDRLNHSSANYVGQPGSGATACEVPSDPGFAERVARQYNAPHSANIISLLKKSQAQYQSAAPASAQSSTRIVLYIVSQLADEYAASADYVTAKKLYEQVLAASRFKEQGWDSLLSSTVRGAQLCCMKLDQAAAAVRHLIELCPLYRHLNCPKEQIQEELIAAVTNPSSLGMSAIAEPVHVGLRQKDRLVMCNARFLAATVHANESVSFKVSLKSNFAAPIRFRRLVVEFDDSHYNSTIEDQGSAVAVAADEDLSSDANLVLLPGKLRHFTFTVGAKQRSTVQFSKVSLQLGEGASSLFLDWIPAEWEMPAVCVDTDFHPELAITITEPESKTEIEVLQLPPALVNEYYRTDVLLRNKGENIRKGTLRFAISHSASGGKATPDLSKSSFYHGPDLTPIDPTAGVEFTDLAAGDERKFVIYVHSLTASRTRSIVVKLSYSTEAFETVTVKKFASPVMLPLAARCAFFSSTFASCIDPNGTTIQADETCMMRVEVQNKCPYPIEIHAADLELNENAALLTSTSAKFLEEEKCKLAAMDKYTAWFTLRPNVSGQDVGIGVFKMRWRRLPHADQLPDSERDNERMVVTPTLVPPLKINKAPFSTEIKLPPSGAVGQSLEHVIRVVNNTSRVEDFSLSIRDTSNFLVAGTKSCNFKIVPQGAYVFTHNIVPLHAGQIPLPHFQITSKRFAKEMATTRQKQFIFIRP